MIGRRMTRLQAIQRTRTLRIFISYSNDDLRSADQVFKTLSIPGVDPFLAERSLPIGASISSTVQQKIRDCDLFVLLWSANAARSEWVRHELGMAAGNSKKVVTVVLDGSVPVPPFLKDFRYIDASKSPETWSTQVAEIVKSDAASKVAALAAKSSEQLAAVLFLVLGALAIAASTKK